MTTRNIPSGESPKGWTKVHEFSAGLRPWIDVRRQLRAEFHSTLTDEFHRLRETHPIMYPRASGCASGIGRFVGSCSSLLTSNPYFDPQMALTHEIYAEKAQKKSGGHGYAACGSSILIRQASLLGGGNEPIPLCYQKTENPTSGSQKIINVGIIA